MMNFILKNKEGKHFLCIGVQEVVCYVYRVEKINGIENYTQTNEEPSRNTFMFLVDIETGRIIKECLELIHLTYTYVSKEVM